MPDPVAAAGVFVTLLAMINPIANVPFVYTVTKDETDAERNALLRRALLVAGVVLVVFAVAGQLIFYAYGLTLPAFRVAGGILLFKIGFDMVTGKPMAAKRTSVEKQEAIDHDDIAVVPLGIPIHAGPGAMTAVLLIAAEAEGTWDWGVLIGSLVAILALSYVILSRAPALMKRMGRSGPIAMSRVLGLIITGVGVRLVELGVRGMGLEA